MLSVKNLVKIYQQKKAEPVRALDGVSIDFADKGLVFLLGKSGSGKSTLLNAIGGLDTFDSGEIIIKGKSSKEFSQSDFDSYRNTFIGFIFQEYNILENFTVEKNLALAIELQHKKPNKEEIHKLLEQVDMLQYAKRKPNQLSGGQKQRVAIARALIKHPEIIMADEPTGALDSNTGKQVMETLKKLSKEKLVIIVSHDREFAEIYGDRIIELKDGKIISDVTKKQIEGTETSDGLKIVDEGIVHIQKGRKVTDAEIKKIVEMINKNSDESDTIISVDKDANKKFKESASITDDGNREKFEKTTEEDVVLKNYNGKSLKLIKSRLKFSDSFKMGASSLKNKVGKLVFTIFLSFLAFTVFGIVDALSCWNRADSVYQAMTMQNQSHIAMIKYTKGEFGADKSAVLTTDYDSIKSEFKDHVIKGVINTSNGYYDTNGSQISVEGYSLTNTNNILKDPSASGYVHLTDAERQKLGFSIEGRLPETDNEVAISKFLFEALVEGTKSQETKITDFSSHNPEVEGTTPLTLRMEVPDTNGTYYRNFTLVGVVDDKTDLSKYTNMSDEELKETETLEYVLYYGWTKLAYITEFFHKSMMTNTTFIDMYTSYEGGNDDRHNVSIRYFSNAQDNFAEKKYDYEWNINHLWRNEEENRFYTSDEVQVRYGYIPEFYEYSEATYVDSFKYLKNGVIQNGNIVLADNEIIVGTSIVSVLGEDVFVSKINEGVKVKFHTDYKGENIVAEYTVVGVTTSYDDFIVSNKTYNDLKPLLTGYSFVVSKLNGTDADKDLVKMLETYDENNVKFSIQGETTPMLDMLEEILLMMTSVFVWVALGFAIFASLMLMNFISTSIAYKKREIGVLRALGARGGDIFGIFFNESMIIAMINFVLAAFATVVGCTLINGAVLANLPVDIVLLNVSIRQVIFIFAISVGAAFIASFLPTFKISRKKPIDAINNR